jgi:hypothetical protein
MRYTLLITALIAAVVFAAPLSADKTGTTGGVWLNASDFAFGTLTAEGPRGSSHKMLLHDSIFGKPYIEVMHNGETYKYDKDAIWGFRDYDGKSYRFVDKEPYEVREAGRLYVYSFNRFVPGAKAGRTAPEYYFSVGAAGPVTELTVANLVTAFPENHRFHDSLEMFSNWDLARFDRLHNTTTVNHLLAMSEGSPR